MMQTMLMATRPAVTKLTMSVLTQMAVHQLRRLYRRHDRPPRKAVLVRRCVRTPRFRRETPLEMQLHPNGSQVRHDGTGAGRGDGGWAWKISAHQKSEQVMSRRAGERRQECRKRARHARRRGACTARHDAAYKCAEYSRRRTSTSIHTSAQQHAGDAHYTFRCCVAALPRRTRCRSMREMRSAGKRTSTAAVAVGSS